MRFLKYLIPVLALILFGGQCYAVETAAQELAEEMAERRGGFGHGLGLGLGLGLGQFGGGFNQFGGGFNQFGGGFNPYAGFNSGFSTFGAVDPYAGFNQGFSSFGSGQCQNNAALLFQQQQFQQFQQVPVPIPVRVPVPVFRPLLFPRLGLGGFGLRRRLLCPRSDERSVIEDVTLDRKKHRPHR